MEQKPNNQQTNFRFMVVTVTWLGYNIVMEANDMSLEEIIFEYADEFHLHVGITTADSFCEQQDYIINAHKQLAGFVSAGILERIHPRITMQGAKSIVVLAMPYAKGIAEKPLGLRGNISIAARGEDYHSLLGKHLIQLAGRLKAADSNISAMSFVDTGPLPEQILAVRAGIGWIGKNGLVHTQRYGSMVFIGYMMVSAELKTFQSKADSCGVCRRCINACPTGALKENCFQIHRCISYLTQKKGLLSSEEMSAMGLQIYGCDQCQISCPHNSWWLQEGSAGFKPADKNKAYPLLEDLLSMDKAEFQKVFQHTAAGWRGRNTIRRNAVIALGNTKEASAMPLLAIALRDTSPVIRQTAARAMHILDMGEGLELLKTAMSVEKDTAVLEVFAQINDTKRGGSNGLLEY